MVLVHNTSERIKADIAQLVGREYAIGGAYEGASQFDKSVALWQPPLQSADADILPSKNVLDARVRDMQRNDGYAQAGVQLHRDHIVGSMYMLNSRPDTTVLGLDDTWATEFQQEVEAKFMLAGESIKNWFDSSRINTFTGLVRLAVGVFTQGGEVLALADWIRETDRPFKSAIQMVDIDRLSTPYDRQGTDSRVRAGVQTDARGKPLGYHIRDAHPQDYMMGSRWQDTMTWSYVKSETPWGRPQALHIKEQFRVDQTRGVADMVAGLKETRIAKKFRDITLQQAVIAAMFAASIESDLPTEAVFGQMGAGNLAPGDAAAAYAGQYLSAVSDYAGSSKNMKIDGVRIPHFFPGTRLSIKQVGDPAGVGQDFEASLLRHVAACLGVSYEELSKDFSKTNYSSARAGMLGTWRFMQARKKIVADRFANFIYWLWLEEQINTGGITSLPANAPNFYDPLMREAYGAADWIGAARGQIDELKETQAAVLRIKFGLGTHEDELARLGKDWRKVYAQLERERIDREARGIVLADGSAGSGAADPASNDPASNDGSSGDAPQKTATAVNVSLDVTGMAEVIAEATGATVAGQRDMLAAVTALAERREEPPVFNIQVEPRVDVAVKSRNGKSTTHVRAYDEKGRILQTETIPEDDDEDDS